MCNKNKTEIFCYLSATANLCSAGTDFLIPVPGNIRLGQRRTSSLSNVASDILKYLKNFCGCVFRPSWKAHSFPISNL